MSDILSVSGDATWSFLLFKDNDGSTSWEIKTLWMQELMERGFLSLGSHNMSYAHSEDDVDRLIGAYDEVFSILRHAVESCAVRQYLKCQPLVPLFKVR